MVSEVRSEAALRAVATSRAPSPSAVTPSRATASVGLECLAPSVTPASKGITVSLCTWMAANGVAVTLMDP